MEELLLLYWVASFSDAKVSETTCFWLCLVTLAGGLEGWLDWWPLPFLCDFFGAMVQQ